jgi:hypothetical protein
LYIQDLRFSADGVYLLALGSLPHFQLTLFQWREGRFLHDVANGAIATALAFHPALPGSVAVFGGSPTVQFWAVTPGFQKSSLTLV